MAKNYTVLLEKDGHTVARKDVEWDGKSSSLFGSDRHIIDDIVSEGGMEKLFFNTLYRCSTVVSTRKMKADETISGRVSSSTIIPGTAEAILSLSLLTYSESGYKGDFGEKAESLLSQIPVMAIKGHKSIASELYAENAEPVPCAVTIYEKGFCLCTGKVSSGMFGDHVTFFQKFTPKKLYSGPLETAKAFQTPKELETFLKKKKSLLSYFPKQYGYHFGITPTCLLFASEYAKKVDGMTDKKVEKEHETWKACLDILEEINSTADEAAVDNIPYGETQEEEAVSRMKMLNIYGPCITRFKKGQLMMSELRGALFFLDEQAEKACEIVRENGNLPYHVIKDDPFYTVLFVSPEKDDWEWERYSPKAETIEAYVYDSNYPINSEYGSVGVAPSSGGVIRAK